MTFGIVLCDLIGIDRMWLSGEAYAECVTIARTGMSLQAR